MGSSSSQLSMKPVTNPYDKKNRSALFGLIMTHDWQKVLVRMHLFPDELSQFKMMKLYGLSKLRVYPLQLMCALDPPAKVIEKAIEYYSDAASIGLRSHRYKVQCIRERIKRWRRDRKGHFPIEEEQLISVSYSHHDEGDRQQTTSVVEYASTLSSKSWKDVILQLSPSGGILPSPMDLSGETESISTQGSFRVQWDLTPLLFEVRYHDGLLPLHLACLFQATPSVLSQLVTAFPMGALTDVLGMLPIHLIAAGWKLPYPYPKPLLEGLAEDIEKDKCTQNVLEAIRVLQDAMPESLRILSGNHAMSALSYVEECMESSDEKDKCRMLLQEAGSPCLTYSFDDCAQSHYSTGLHIFEDDGELSTIYTGNECAFASCMHSLIQQKDWDGILQTVEMNPSTASRWIYGIEEISTRSDLRVWKRLPIHLACLANAPRGVLEALLVVFPSGAQVPDPQTGQTSLHIICCMKPPLPTVSMILSYYERAAHELDHEARSPLHLAVAMDAATEVVELLLAKCPESVTYIDASGKTPIDAALEALGEHHKTTDLLMLVLLHLSAQP